MGCGQIGHVEHQMAKPGDLGMRGLERRGGGGLAAIKTPFKACYRIAKCQRAFDTRRSAFLWVTPARGGVAGGKACEGRIERGIILNFETGACQRRVLAWHQHQIVGLVAAPQPYLVGCVLLHFKTY